jgi:hypothetical protein
METPIKQNPDEIEPMSHREALDMGAVELYLLNDLLPEQRLRFEAHYFQCPACANAVTVGQTFMHAVRPVPEPWWRRLAFPVLTPATAVLLVLLTFQNVSTIPSLRSQLAFLSAPQPNTVIVAHPSEKGQLDTAPVKTDSLTIEIVLPADATSPFYRIDIQGPNRSVSQIVPAPDGSRLSLHASKQALGYGTFDVRVSKLATRTSQASGSPEHYYFTIQ